MKLKKIKELRAFYMQCEVDYRRGVSQGFYAHEHGEITLEQAEAFWTSGLAEGFSLGVDPVSGGIIRRGYGGGSFSFELQKMRFLEMRYRKGYLRGCQINKNHQSTDKKIRDYRSRASINQRVYAEDPVTGKRCSVKELILSELETMDDMEGLKAYIYST